ncbi:MAG: hypothetical protein IKN43_14195 [Selenomonadaceae bacterium]|nr:hypothetical protein [Selenomonadaceae bacterium]
MNEDISRYQDIINLPHHISKRHPRLSPEQRAAQFSPFAALTGYEDAANETSRLTEEKVEFSDDESGELNRKLQKLKGKVIITYFVNDEKKSGGAYVSIKGEVKRIDNIEKVMIMQDKSKIQIDDILNIEYCDE